MDYSRIVKLFKSQIDKKTSIQNGIAELDILLKDLVGVSLPNTIDINRLENEFKSIIINILNKNKPSSNIKALYFGLTTIVGPNNMEQTSIHINGSKVSPDSDDEWACNVDYRDQTYFSLTDFNIIDNLLIGDFDDRGIAEVIVFNGLLNLLIISSIKTIKDLTFIPSGLFSKPRQVLWIGAGYDSGDCYLISKIEK